MASSSFLPLAASPASPLLLPHRPSLDAEREVLSTRGQRLLGLFPALGQSEAPVQERPTFLRRRGSLLVGHSNPRYEW